MRTSNSGCHRRLVGVSTRKPGWAREPRGDARRRQTGGATGAKGTREFPGRPRPRAALTLSPGYASLGSEGKSRTPGDPHGPRFVLTASGPTAHSTFLPRWAQGAAVLSPRPPPAPAPWTEPSTLSRDSVNLRFHARNNGLS